MHLHRFSGYPTLLIELQRACRFHSALHRRAPYLGRLPSRDDDVTVLWGRVADLDEAVRTFRRAMPDVVEVAGEGERERRERYRGRLGAQLKGALIGAVAGLSMLAILLAGLFIGGPGGALVALLIVLIGLAGFARWQSN